MSHRRAMLLVVSPLCLVLSLIARDVAAQSIPNAITGLEITPDGGTPLQILQGHSLTLEFVAHNGLITPGTWSFTCSRTGGVSCGAVVPSSATIPAGGSREIDVTFTATAAGGARITLSATGGHTGFFNITVQALGAPSAVVTRN